MYRVADPAEYRQRSYELWQRMASRWERGRAVLWETTRPVSEWLVDQLAPQPGETILELAAGAGETGFLAAARLGDHGLLISSDFAPQMVESAKRVAAELGITNAEFRVLDAESLELDDGSVDGMLCRFGYMLMAEPGRALRESRRVVKNGRLAFSVFGEPERNPWMTVAQHVMVERGHLPPADPDEPGLFSLRHPDRIEALLTEAGFVDIELEEMPIAFRFDDATPSGHTPASYRARSRSRSASSSTRIVTRSERRSRRGMRRSGRTARTSSLAWC